MFGTAIEPAHVLIALAVAFGFSLIVLFVKRTEVNATRLGREQAELLDNAQRLGRMGSWKLDLRTGRLTWPDATCRLFGIAPSDFDGTFAQFHDLILPEDVAGYDAADARVSVSQPVFEAEYRIRRPDGAVRWMCSRGHLETDPTGTPVRRIGVVMDVTDQHVASEQLADTVTMLRIAGRVAHLGGWTIQLPSRVLTWSDETCAIHDLPAGYQPTLDEGLGYFPPEYRDEVRRHVEACERDGTGYDFEVPKITASGRRIWVRSIGEAVRDADGRIVRLQGAFQDITTRRLAEQALRESEAEFRALAESMPQMVWVTRPDGWNTYFNQRWVDYTGLSLEDSYGHGWNTPFHPDDRQRAADAWQQAIAGGDYHVEGRLRRADGTYRWMLIRGVPLRDSAGHTVKWIGTYTDIDDLMQAQETAQLSEAVQRALAAELRRQAHMLDEIGQAVIATDTDGRVTYANRVAGELYGWPPSEMVGRVITEVTVPQDSRERGEEILSLLRRGDTWSGEFLVQTRQGRVFPAHVTDSPVMDEHGRLVGIIGISTDITARKQAEDEARQKDALIRIAGRLTHTGGWSIDLPGNGVFWSDELFDILGYPRGKTPLLADALAFYPTAAREQVVAALHACQQHGTPFDLETEVVTASGARKWVRISAEAERDANGSITRVQGAFQDITDRRQLEQQYLRAQRMESIGTLAGGIAHDLNNVLAPILMSIGMLQHDERDSERLQILATIEASAKRGAAMVGRVLSFARGVEGRRERVLVPELMRDLATIIRDTFPKNITVDVHLGPDLWALQADATQLHQVLLNLCVNARDAMPAGGQITLRANNVRIDQAYAAVNIDARSGPHVSLIVEDTGDGIPKDIIDRIFDPFFTTKGIGKGTGLGLSTSLAIVTGHQGFMRVDSTPETGTRFEVYLPAQTTLAEQASPAPVAAHPRGNGETVLVVDDEAAIREIARRTLEGFGYRVMLAGGGAEAIALYVKHQAAIAVVLTDMMMPLMDGTATIQELVRINPDIRIIGTSGLAIEPLAAGAAGARVVSFLPKPYTAKTLLAAISAALPSAPEKSKPST